MIRFSPTRPVVAFFLAAPLLLAMAACTPNRPPFNALLIAAGEYHDYETEPELLARRLTRRGRFQVDLTHDVTALSADSVAHYHVLVFNTCHQVKLPQEVRDAIMNHVTSGGGLVAMHCSLWSYQDWPAWFDLLGGFVETHDTLGPYELQVSDTDDPIVRGLGMNFEMVDEPYLVDQRDDDAIVLIETAAVHQHPQGLVRVGPEPQAWIKTFGDGRVFVTTLGHDQRTQRREEFLTLLHSGMRWAARDLEPPRHNVLTESERMAGYQSLFNGNDLSGYQNVQGNWQVINGELVGRPNSDDAALLAPGGERRRFQLRFSFKMPAGTLRLSHDSFDNSSQWCLIIDTHKSARVQLAAAGSSTVEADTLPSFAPRGWNHAELRIDGQAAFVRINGIEVARVPAPPAGWPITPIVWTAQLADDQAVFLRDLRIRPLP